MQKQKLSIGLTEERHPGQTNTESGYSLVRNASQTRNAGDVVSVFDVLDDNVELIHDDIGNTIFSYRK